jgi:hypothetical protein
LYSSSPFIAAIAARRCRPRGGTPVFLQNIEMSDFTSCGEEMGFEARRAVVELQDPL